MKVLFFLAACLVALMPRVSAAQVGPEVYSVATPAQIQTFTSGQSQGITAAIFHRIIRATCTVACYLRINAPGQSESASKATGIYLPADTPTLFSVTPGSKVQAIGDTATGRIHVQELSK